MSAVDVTTLFGSEALLVIAACVGVRPPAELTSAVWRTRATLVRLIPFQLREIHAKKKNICKLNYDYART